MCGGTLEIIGGFALLCIGVLVLGVAANAFVAAYNDYHDAKDRRGR